MTKTALKGEEEDEEESIALFALREQKDSHEFHRLHPSRILDEPDRSIKVKLALAKCQRGYS